MRILAVGHDPGGISVITPVLTRLMQLQHEVVIISEGLGLKNFDNKGLQAVDITSCCGINSAKLSSWINDSGFNLVLTGTSAYHLLEREIWKACELIGIKTFAILDHWLNYSIRFTSNPNKRNICETFPIDCKPDIVFAMDDNTKDELKSLSFEEENIIVSGHPSLYQIFSCQEDKQRKQDFPARIIYFSEPIEEIYGSNNKWGFDEYSVIKILFYALDKIDYKHTFIIKAHPKQSINWSKLKEIRGRYNINFKYIKNTKMDIGSTDIIVGTFTMALIEATIRGNKCISIIPNNHADKYSIIGKKKLGAIARNSNDLIKLLRQKEVINNNIEKEFSFKGDPVETIILVLEEYYNGTCN